MLNRLQGTTHQVVTGVALVDAATGKERVIHCRSRVTMRRLTPEEVRRHARKNLDKAGSYAAQEKRDPVIRRVQG